MKLTLVPAYGRDYKSKSKVVEALAADQDFEISDMSSQWDGKPANLSALKDAGYKTLNIRYKKLANVAVVDISGDTPKAK